jgi:hypothetical protein
MSAWVPLCKALISFVKGYDKKIPNFQLYFNAKKYNSFHSVNLTDRERYNMLMNTIIEFLMVEEILQNFILDVNEFKKELRKCLQSEIIYNALYSNFSKGAFGKMCDDLNRQFIPKKTNDDDDIETEEPEEDPIDNLKKQVKYYSYDFEKLLVDCNISGYKFYEYKIKRIDESEDDTIIKEEMLIKDIPVFSIYRMDNDNIYSLWISQSPLDYTEITVNEFIDFIKQSQYSLNPEHLTNIDTIKRNYINKQFDLFTRHSQLLIRSNSLFFYNASYLHSADYNDYNELQFINAVNCFPTSFEDYVRNTFAIFYFDKQDVVNINSFWITTKPIELIMSEYDKNLFIWKEITCNDFITSNELNKNLPSSMLH